MLSHIPNVIVSCLMVSVRSLVRILKDMQKHVPGLQHLESWYIQLLVSNSRFLVMVFHECSFFLVQLFSDSTHWRWATVIGRWLQKDMGAVVSRIVLAWFNRYTWPLWGTHLYKIYLHHVSILVHRRLGFDSNDCNFVIFSRACNH